MLQPRSTARTSRKPKIRSCVQVTRLTLGYSTRTTRGDLDQLFAVGFPSSTSRFVFGLSSHHLKTRSARVSSMFFYFAFFLDYSPSCLLLVQAPHRRWPRFGGAEENSFPLSVHKFPSSPRNPSLPRSASRKTDLPFLHLLILRLLPLTSPPLATRRWTSWV